MFNLINDSITLNYYISQKRNTLIISILHLSDFHFKIGQNSFLDKITNLTDSIKNKMFDIKTLFILISGDLAYSGKKEEYVLLK